MKVKNQRIAQNVESETAKRMPKVKTNTAAGVVMVFPALD
jgi:hypothetical protein